MFNGLQNENKKKINEIDAHAKNLRQILEYCVKMILNDFLQKALLKCYQYGVDVIVALILYVSECDFFYSSVETVSLSFKL